MAHPPASGERTWSRRTVIISAIVALAMGLCCAALAVVFAGLDSFDDISAVTVVHRHWQEAGIYGECLLAASAVLIGVLGLWPATARPRLAAVAVLIIPVEFGWLLVTAFFGGLWSS